MPAAPDLIPAAGARSLHTEVRKALDTWVAVRMQMILPALVVIYLAGSSVGLVFKPIESTGILGWSAYSAGAVSFVAWLLLRRNCIPANRVHLVALVIGSLILFHSLAEFYVSGDASQVEVITLLLLGSASILLSWQEFAFTAILSVAGWVVVGLQKLPLSSLIHGLLVLVTTVAVSGLGVWLRLRKHSLVQAARLSEETQRIAEKRIRDRFELAVQGTHDGLWYWDLKSNVFYGSASWAAMLGYREGELENNPDEWFSRVHPGYLTDLRTQLAAHLEGHSEQFHHEHRLCRKDGTYRWVMARATAVRNDAGEAVELAGSHADITSVIDVENRLLDDSFYDKLTRLPNRHFFMCRLEKAIERKKRKPNRPPLFAVMFLDLDRFKIINDSLGHLAGDQLLEAVAGRLKNCARPDDVVARFGGDEFVILLEKIRDPEEASNVAARIQNALSRPFHIGNREVASGVSIGIVLSSEATDSTEDFVRYADMAMYQAKSKGKGQSQIFNENMQAQVTKLCDLQTDLSRAVERQQLLLHYQPCVSLRSGKILGVEALVRWQRSTSQLVQPMDFIPLAEELGLINDIGDWVLRSACAQNSAWQQAGMPPIRMAVNVSARQLQQKDFPQRVHCILEETKLKPQWLELELTETALMSSLDAAPQTLAELGAMGMPIAIDDFGTGYSSLDYLRRFNFSTLKMDRCFVSDIVTDKKAAAVARGLITLAHNLDLSVTAEGVEHNAQLSFLATEHCDQVQGFLACRPTSAEHLRERLSSGDAQEGFAHGSARPFVELHQLARYASGRSGSARSRFVGTDPVQAHPEALASPLA
jgi:diguanylate cyclase (GGDEF)-like protein/PAS domain S-box-containing protein